MDKLLRSSVNFKKQGNTKQWEINLKDKNTNSLKQLNGYTSTMGLIEGKRKLKTDESWKREDVMFKGPDTASVAISPKKNKKNK